MQLAGRFASGARKRESLRKLIEIRSVAVSWAHSVLSSFIDFLFSFSAVSNLSFDLSLCTLHDTIMDSTVWEAFIHSL